MGKSLVIVESPAKAQIINRYLGDNYVVRASVGHIRDLPVSAETTTAGSSRGSAAIYRRMGVYPHEGWRADYQIMPDKQKVVSELRRLAAHAEQIYLATDLDREGEAIAWHLREVLGGDEQRYLRVKYPEITKSAITKAFANPGRINMDLVNAQQARRFLDRVVGFMVSPVLWKKVARGLSAGRVQSVAAELIVDREREIKAFVPEEYWLLGADTHTPAGEALHLALATRDGHKLEIHNRAEVETLVEQLKVQRFVVSKIERKRGTQRCPPPFTTSTLQQVANQRLGFSVRRTMTIAQHLYERGLITYMRTDSVSLSQEAVERARNIVSDTYGARYVPERPVVHQSGESAQEAHEAIRPSHPDEEPGGLDRDEQRLYDLIMKRYLASQMAPQEYESTSVTVTAGPFGLKASGRHVIFDGFRRVWGAGSGDEVELPELSEGMELKLAGVTSDQHFTQPPARYSEATLVREMEKAGIGRPSTYAAIISTIQERGYVQIERGRFHAMKMGEIVTDRLRASFRELMDPSFTAGMETGLDRVAAGKENWRDNLDRFFADFERAVERAGQDAASGGMPENRALEITSLRCPQCGRYNMAVHTARTGVFLSCQGYYDKQVPAAERCRKTMNLKLIDPAAKHGELTDEQEAALLRDRPRCPRCKSVMDSYLVDEHRKLHLCSATNCDGWQLEQGDFTSEIEHGPEITCERCGAVMVMKEGRFGKYMSCTGEGCGNTRKILKNGTVAPPKEEPVDLPELPCQASGAHYMLRDGAAGIFLAAHNFPKVRKTRPVKVAELKRFRDRLPPKFHYLADGPQTDPDGNFTEVRFSRKTKTQYLAAVKSDGKPSGWTAFYNAEKQQWQAVVKSAAARGGAAAKRKTRSAGKRMRPRTLIVTFTQSPQSPQSPQSQ